MNMKKLLADIADTNFQREDNVLKRYPRIEKAIPLVERKIQIEKDWEKNEIRSWLPAAKLDENRLGGDPFSNLSSLFLIIMALSVFPIPFLAFPVYKVFKRRKAKLEELKEINKQLKSVLPAKYCPEQDFVPFKYRHLVPYLFKEGIFFNNSGKEILRNI